MKPQTRECSTGIRLVPGKTLKHAGWPLAEFTSKRRSSQGLPGRLLYWHYLGPVHHAHMIPDRRSRTVSLSVSYFTVPPRAHPSTGQYAQPGQYARHCRVWHELLRVTAAEPHVPDDVLLKPLVCDLALFDMIPKVSHW